MAYTRYNRANPDASGKFRVVDGHVEAVPGKSTRSQRVVEWTLFSVMGVLLVVGAIALWSSYSPEHKAVPNTVDLGWKRDRINLVIIGIGGERHPGGGKDLADAILFVSLKPSTRQAAVISVPRDFWVKIGRYGAHRLNQAHAIGNDGGYPGEGPGLLCDTISQIFHQPVDAFVRIDFAAFEKMIDTLGGVDIHVQRSFYDYLFHDGFRQGKQHLDGRRALAYARYRYILGPEGDNFARELRQQQVVNAVREKLQRRSPQDVVRLIHAISTLSNATDTNLSTGQMITLYRTFNGVRQDDVRNVSLKPFMEIFQVTRLSDPGKAVRPRRGDYQELREVARHIFEERGQISTQDQIHLAATPEPPPQPRTIHMSVY